MVNQKSYAILLLLVFSLTSNILHAHSRGESYSKWTITEQGAQLTYTLSLKDIGLMTEAFQGSEPNWENRVREHVQQYTHLSDNGFPCSIKEPFQFRQANGYLQIEGVFLCHSTEQLQIKMDSIFNIDSRHMHIARVSFPNGDLNEKDFLERDREWQLFENNSEKGVQGSTFLNYLVIGVEHIVTGWDHLAFLAAVCLLLLLMQASNRTLLIVISGFTLGHSASLVLTVLGYLHPNGLVVESFIALSIALLAIESIAFKNKHYFFLSIAISLALLLYLFLSQYVFSSAITGLSMLGLCVFVLCYFNLSSQTSGTMPQSLLTLLFGLVHGFGFAGSLQEIGLPTDRLILALVSFNLGVELGQLVIVGITLSLLFKIGKWLPNFRKELPVELSAAFLTGLGTFWFIERSVL